MHLKEECILILDGNKMAKICHWYATDGNEIESITTLIGSNSKAIKIEEIISSVKDRGNRRTFIEVQNNFDGRP